MLLRKKSMGAAWNGTLTVPVTEPYSGQVYNVKFSRPVLIPIFLRITVRTNGAAYPDVPGVVRTALLDYANGDQSEEDGFVVGGDVSAFELASAVNREAAPLFVQDLSMSTDGVTYSAATIHITIAQMATLLEGNIAVTVAA